MKHLISKLFTRNTPPAPLEPEPNDDAEITELLESLAGQFAGLSRMAHDRGLFVSIRSWDNDPAFLFSAPAVFVKRKSDDA